MVANYSDNLRITLQGDNDNPGTWGQVTNEQVIELLEEAITGVVEVDITGSSDVDISITTNNGATDNARHAVLELTGTLGANINLIVPSVEKIYVVRGAWTGNYAVSVKPSGGATDVDVSTGQTVMLYTRGTNIYNISGGALLAANNLSDVADASTARTNLGLGSISTQAASAVAITGGSITGITDLTIADGGTNASTAADAFNNLKQAATITSSGVVELATSAEVMTGTDAERAVTPSTLAAGVGFSGYAETSEGTITSRTTTTLAHTLGKRPKFAQVILKCTTTDQGWSVGDEMLINVTSSEGNPGNGDEFGYSLIVDASNAYVNTRERILVAHKTTGVWNDITFSKWKYVVRVWG